MKRFIRLALALSVILTAPGPAAARVLGKIVNPASAPSVMAPVSLPGLNASAATGLLSAPQLTTTLPAIDLPLPREAPVAAAALSRAVPVRKLEISDRAFPRGSAASTRRWKAAGSVAPAALETAGRQGPAEKREPRVRGVLRSIAAASEKTAAGAADAPAASLKRDADFTLPAAPERPAVSAAGVQVSGRPLRSLLGRSRVANFADESADAAPQAAAPLPPHAPSAKSQFAWSAFWTVRAAAEAAWAWVLLTTGVEPLLGLTGPWIVPVAAATLAFAAWEAVSAAAYALQGARIANNSFPPHASRQLRRYTDARARGRGFLTASFLSSLSHPAYLAREISYGMRKTWAGAKGVARTLRAMATGDRSLAWILKPYRKKIILATALLVVDGLLAIGLSYALGPLLDTAVLAGQNGIAAYAATLTWLGAGIIGGFLLYLIVERQHALLGRLLAIWSARDYRVVLKRVLLGRSMDFHARKEHASAALAKRLKDDTGYLSGKEVEVRISLLHYGLYAVFGIAMMFYTSPALTALVLAIVPFLAWINGIFGERWNDLSYELEDEMAGLMAKSQETLSQAAAVKSFGRVEHEVDRYAQNADKVRMLDEKNAKLTADYNILSSSLGEFFTEYLLYILGAWVLALGWGLSFGQIIQMTAFAGFVKYAFDGLSENYLSYKKYEGKTEVIRGFLKDASPHAPAPARARPFRGDIIFEGVDFSYGGPDGDKVLNGLSFTARPGETIALVGGTGSGKSTVANLLMRLWEPQGGSIRVDGRALADYDRADFLKSVAYVPQDTRLFNESIRFNMTYGAGAVSEEALKEAIAKAKAGFVFDARRFPQGLDTPVAEGGGRLSGGERQRIAIVRAFLRTPSLLVLDEATSALDNSSERVVQEALDELVKDGSGPTTVVIAHRLTTIKNADVILFLEDGKVAERGSHAQLLALGGRYAELWSKDADAPPSAGPSPEAAAEPSVPAQPEAVSPVKPAPIRGGFRPLQRLKAALRAALSAGSMLVNFVRGDRVAKPFLKKHRGRVAATMALLILNAGLLIAASLWTGQLLDAAQGAATAGLAAVAPSLWLLSGLAAGVFLLSLFVERAHLLWSGIIHARFERDTRVELKRRLLRRDMNFHLANDSGEMASRLNDDVESFALKNIDVRLPLIKNVLLLAASAYFLFAIDFKIAALVFGVVPFLGIINGVFGQLAERVYEIFVKRRAELGRHAQETLEQIRAVKTFAQEENETGRYAAKAQALVDIGEKEAHLGANAHVLTSSLTSFFTVYMIYILGAWALAAAAGMTIGQITQMTFLAGFVKVAFDGLSEGWMQYRQAHGATAVIRAWLAAGDAPDPTGVLPDGPGRLEFSGVEFRYREDAAPVLNGLSLAIRPGETVAFVGESGSGKSSILRLVQGLWKATGGRVLLDGADISETAPSALAGAIAVVPQDTRLFDESIRYNMLYGVPEAGESVLREAIKMAQAHFVYDKKLFPEGLETRVGSGGERLSGGQRQRVAIVRALLKNPRVLLLDEATSALDKKTERRVQTAFDGIKAGPDGRKPTTLVVAHNLTTIKGADRIVVLDGGRVVETGTHAALLAKNGAYAKLWRAAR